MYAKISMVSANAVDFNSLDGGASRTMKIDEQTKISLDGKAAKIADLHVGHFIHEMSEEATGTNLALSIECRSAGWLPTVAKTTKPATPDTPAK